MVNMYLETQKVDNSFGSRFNQIMFGLDSALMLLRKHITLESVFKTLLKANENKSEEKKERVAGLWHGEFIFLWQPEDQV